MRKTVKDVLAANAAYVERFNERGELPLRPSRRFGIVTCLDARLDPAQFAGAQEGEAHIIRNAGGRVTDDVLRSIVTSQKFAGTLEWFVIQHTKCGLQYVTNEEMAQLFEESLDAASLHERKWKNPDLCTTTGSTTAASMDFYPIHNLEETVLEDVQKIRNHPLVLPQMSIYGFIFDVETGKLHEVEAASIAGMPKELTNH